MKKNLNNMLRIAIVPCMVASLCAGVASCDDDDEIVAYTNLGIEYAFHTEEGDGVTSEWHEFSATFDNPSDTVMRVTYHPCEGMYAETTFQADDPARYSLTWTTLEDTLTVHDIKIESDGSPTSSVPASIPYIGGTCRTYDIWHSFVGETVTFDVQPRTSVTVDGEYRVDHIVASYTLHLVNAATQEPLECTGKLVKTAPTTYFWYHSPNNPLKME